MGEMVVYPYESAVSKSPDSDMLAAGFDLISNRQKHCGRIAGAEGVTE